MASKKHAVLDSDVSWVAPKLPVVGIGASAGGIKALRDFFEVLPADTGAAFVVIVHLDPENRSELAEILAARTRMPVMQVTGKSKLEKDCIYVIPPDRQLRITDDEIAAERFEEPRGHRAPIDLFFRSLAAQRGDGFAVILTGAGSDGAIGVKVAKEAGAIILVQDPNEAEYSSMPRSAIETGAVDFVLPVRDLAAHLVELVRTKLQAARTQKGDEEEQLRRVLTHLRVRTGHDFTHYKRSTLMRRILRRMQVARKDTLEGYFAFLRENPEEAQALLADLLISVTTFFRDPKAFETLAKHAIPRLFENNAHEGSVIRVWVAGCATGEEAYSLAMLLLEEASRHDTHPEIQVFASDLDAKALMVAREGRYPAAIEADLNEDRLRRFFTRDGEMYRVKRELRDLVLFANHSILKDPPFSRLDLVSCRNLLIYLDRDLQQQVLLTLQYGLKTDGYLFLGSSESAEHADGLFRTVDREARLYQSAGRNPDRFPVLPRLLSSAPHIEPPSVARARPSIRGGGAESHHREALEEVAPPSVLVDDNFRVLHFSETAGRYMRPPRGPMTADITELVREELRCELRSALHRAFEGEDVLSAAILVGFDGHRRRVYIQVKPVPYRNQEARRVLVLFVEGGAEDHSVIDVPSVGEVSNEDISHLKQELEIAQARLRTSRETSEGVNEELRAANEELQSINEEYRSTAEELETSKEELQSINEELQTVNAELKLKLETVSRANSDLQNLMAAADFATLFLDPSLKIKRFTSRLTELFSITPHDVGRPITDFTHQLDYDALPADARQVLTHLTPVEREIRSHSGGWYLVRFRPYRTIDDKIDGVVVTFVNVTERRKMEDALRTSEERLRQESRLVELSRAPIFVWDLNSQIVKWNRGSEELYGYREEEALGQLKETLLKTTVPGSSFQAVKAALLQDGAWKGELNQVAKDGRSLTVESQIELFTVGDRRYVLESTRDITQSKVWEARQQLLLRELTHRVKNTLTVVQSMIHQTWRTSPSGEEFIRRLDGRIAALANSHKLFVEAEWEGAELRDIIEGQMSPQIGTDPARVTLQGPDVRLPPDLAMPLGLVLHELATNAAKYGGLSTDRGGIKLVWELIPGNKSTVLRVIWEEMGGPLIKKTPARGFGSRLIKTGVPGSKVEHEFLTEGVRCTIEIRMSGATEHGSGS